MNFRKGLNFLFLSKGRGLKITSFLLSTLTATGLYLLTACSPQPQPLTVGPNSNIDRSSSFSNSRSSRSSSNRFSSRSRRVNCREIGNNEPCEGNIECEDICIEIFSNNTDKGKCIDLSVSLVEDFYDITQIMDDGNEFDSINPDSLKCLLNISETEFLRDIGKLNSSKAKDFLEVLSYNQDLVNVVKSEEAILERLLREISEDSLRAFEVKVEGSSNFIDLIVDHTNEEAWKWVIDYISDECSGNEYCNHAEASNNEQKELFFFCKTYKSSSSSNLRDLLSNTFFSERYRDTIEGIECGGSPCSDSSTDFLGANGNSNTVCAHFGVDRG